MRRMILMAVLAIVGCGQAAPPPLPPAKSPFADEAQELRYLKTIKQPTPEQFARLEALERKELLDAVNREFPGQYVKDTIQHAHELHDEGKLDEAIAATDEAIRAAGADKLDSLKREAEGLRKALVEKRDAGKK